MFKRSGKYPPREGESDVIGLEMAGEVMECGSKSSFYKSGARVFGLLPGGGYAEYCVISGAIAMPLPDSYTYAGGGEIPGGFMTACRVLVLVRVLDGGEVVLV